MHHRRGPLLLAGVLIAALTGGAAAMASPATHRSNAAKPQRHATASTHHRRQYALTVAGSAGDRFGTSVAISGRTVVVGAPYRTVRGHKAQGRVYVYEKPAGGWAHAKPVTTLTLSHGRTNDGFGWSVAVSGNTIVVGAPGRSVGTYTQRGAAFVFVKPSAGWAAIHHPTGALTPVDRATHDKLGLSVAISDNTIVAGAPGHVVGEDRSQGAAYVFPRPSGGWSAIDRPAVELVASDGSVSDSLGFSVDISGPRVVAGAIYARVGSHTQQGAAYVFARSSSGWGNATERAKLTASPGAASEFFGYAVAINGPTVISGAPYRTVGRNALQGAAYVFVKPSAGWHSTSRASATLTSKPGVPNGFFGEGVAAWATHVGVAGYGLDSVFNQPAHGWSGRLHQNAQLTGAASFDALGNAIAGSGRTIVAGAPRQPVGSHAMQGAAYIYIR